MQKLAFSIVLLLSCCSLAHAQTAKPPAIPTVEFCELVRNAAKYDGKRVRVRAAYFSAFEISGFGEPAGRSCHENSMVWVDFDPSVESTSKPEIAKRLRDAFYGPTIDSNGNIQDEWLMWKTEMLVTGAIFKPNGRGYGHTSIYSHKFVVSTVEELGAVTKTDPLKTRKP